MTGDVNFSLDLGGAAQALGDRFLSLFGRDELSTAARAALNRQLETAARHAASVQVIGMDRPVSIFKIYQTTRFRRPWHDETISFSSILREHQDAVILGGPGTGKTILTTTYSQR